MVAESIRSKLERCEAVIDENYDDALVLNAALHEIRERLGVLWPEWCLDKFGKSSTEMDSMMALVSLVSGDEQCPNEQN